MDLDRSRTETGSWDGMLVKSASVSGQSADAGAFRDRLLFLETPEPIWVLLRHDMRIVDVNRAACERFGYTREQYLGMELGDFHPKAAVERLREAWLRHEEDSNELRGWSTKTASGENVETDLSVRFLEVDGNCCALICALDMTARKTLEDRLRQAGKMEAIGMLAGGIAHDFNNLLTIISGYSQLLLNVVADSERSSIEQILKASERAAQLTSQLLAFSRRKDLQPQAVDINRIVSGMSTMLRRLIGEHIELRLALANGLGAVHADPGQLDQVLMNLVVNARDAMAQGGKLVIETANVDLSEGYTGKDLGLRPGRYVMIAVNDSGVGMDQKTRERVFDPFFTTKEKGKGTGLGLSTVYGVVKQAGGTIDLYSEPQHGTSVKVYLPRAGDISEAERQAPAFTDAAGGRETVLVVEDEDAVRRLVRSTLERGGYRVLVASGGPEALDVSRREEHIDLLLTDLVMPQMSGVEVATRVRQDRPGIRILFMSGYTDRSLQETWALPESTEFLQKPFTPATLSIRVREILDKTGEANEQSLTGNL